MKKHVITVVAFVLFLTQGCGQKQDSITNSDNTFSTPSTPPTEVVQILDENTVEAEFKIAEILTAPSGGNFYANDSMYDVYIVTFLWGKLTNDPSLPNLPTTWDGTLGINGPSYVKYLHSIDFENGEDSIIHDDVPSGESWGSRTSEGFDGAVFLLIYDKVTPTFAQQLLTFDTQPFTVQFDFYQLIHLYAFYHVDAVNSVAVYAHRISPHNCREGYFTGDWKKGNNSGSEGSFAGLWFTHNGDTVGTVNGLFWTTADNAHLMQGIISGLYTNNIIGTLHGVWGFDDMRMCPICGQGHGMFRGRVQFESSDNNGYFRGEFGNYSLPPDDSIMPFHGNWTMNCVTLANSDFPPSQ